MKPRWEAMVVPSSNPFGGPLKSSTVAQSLTPFPLRLSNRLLWPGHLVTQTPRGQDLGPGVLLTPLFGLQQSGTHRASRHLTLTSQCERSVSLACESIEASGPSPFLHSRLDALKLWAAIGPHSEPNRPELWSAQRNCEVCSTSALAG